MSQPLTVDRTHTLRYTRLNQGKIEGGGIIKAFYKVIESYKNTSLYHWYEDQDGNKYRKCSNSHCTYFGSYTTTNKGWVCKTCTDAEKARKHSNQMRKEYGERFSARILEAAKAARKALPNYNSRKGRDKLTLVYNEDADRAKINEVIGKFNLKLRDHDSYIESNDFNCYRKQATVVDINPFRKVEIQINGEYDV